MLMAVNFLIYQICLAQLLIILGQTHDTTAVCVIWVALGFFQASKSLWAEWIFSDRDSENQRTETRYKSQAIISSRC